MGSLRVSELRCKEVINIKDGARLGFVDDVEFEAVNGHIVALTVLGPARLLGLFGRCDDYYIRWCDIEKIGHDIILICMDVPDRVPRKKSGGFFSSWFK